MCARAMQAILAENNKCPFTGQPLSWADCIVLTRTNVHRYRDRILL